ncbi:MAG: hypothetical protein WC492_00295 [Candidatus Micrarchaeia archaeon]
MSKLPNLKDLDLSFLKKGQTPAQKAAAEPDSELEELKKKMQVQKMQLELMYMIIERYKKFIEDGESKSISDLRTLVRPMDSVITEVKIGIEDQFHPYVYDSNFLLATQRAMDLVFSWKKVKLPVSFWMGFEDMVHLKAADDIDRAIFLCSLFRALGSDSAKVVIGKDRAAWTFFTFGEKDYVVNIGDRTMSAYPNGGDGIKLFMRTALYSFNDKDYSDLSEGQ